MLKILLYITIVISYQFAVTPEELRGNWHASRESTSNGTLTVENEYLHLKADDTFSIQIFVNVEKGDAFIKGLRIEGSGIWKSRDDTLVIYIKKVEVPFAKEIYLISQESLRKLANNFKYKYESAPLRIIKIESFTGNQLNTSNEGLIKTSYIRN